ncbi:MAG: transglutaminase domain-containing protein [Bacteroidales bacterium]|nr:transglutaminase domain-containing protein [Bacteroidales bacterium]
MKRHFLLFIALLGWLFCAFTPSGFAQADYWSAVREDFQNRQDIPGEVRDKIGMYNLKTAADQSRNMAKYLMFLYAYMPQSDLADYDFEFFEDQVKVAMEARKTFSWGATIPDDIFRHFVVVYRVNNENLDTARAYIFHQLKKRIQNMSMYDAALEVNHWCHEYVDYQPADVRTSAPLATLKTSHGRCGEESTLTVTALRAVGIPARQCYTPRWAHCDDNHAWVEVWVDGKWWFLGACEPAPALNMGWFANVSTRTMMVHTNVFGRYDGPEEVNKRTPYYSCINLLSNYADTATAYVTVYDKRHLPAKDATVCFKLYNYAEYYTLAEVKTDENGRAKLNTGLGDLLIWAKQGDDYSYAQLDLRKQDHLVLILSDKGPNPWMSPAGNLIQRFDMVPPVGKPLNNNVSASAQMACDKRLAKEDKMREAYRATFPTKAQTDKYRNDYFNSDEYYDVIHRSEGNHAEIIKFLQAHPKRVGGLYLKEFVNALADKDLRDTKAETLEKQLTVYKDGKYPISAFVRGILPARISNELIRDWRGPLREAIVGAIPNTVITADKLLNWTKQNITVDPLCNYYNCPISPMGVMKTRRTDAHSRDIFFVAACRSLDIPCYLDNASNQLYVWEKGDWQEVTFEEEEVVPLEEMATLTLHNPKGYTYYIHYTLQRFENGEYVSYDFENDPRVETRDIVLVLPPGKYCLSTGNRYSDGEVLSELHFFTLNKKDEYTIKIPELVQRNNTYGHLDMNINKLNNKSLSDMLNESGKDRVVLCLVAPGTEPTNHLAKELAAKKADYEAWGGKVLLVANNTNWKKEKNQPANVEVFSAKVNDLTESVLAALKNAVHDGSLPHTTGERPVCLILDKDGNILFVSEGYHIGLGDLLLEGVK